jgi:2-iminobutanoate/2-iminopropanoate deaminase
MKRILFSRRFFIHRVGLASGAVLATFGIGRSAFGQEKPRHGGGRRKAYGLPRNKLFSRAVKFDQTIYISGVVGGDADGRINPDFELQAMRTMLNLKEAVERSGSKIGNVLKCNCYLTRSQDFAKFNEVYAQFFPDSPPARTTVVVKELVVAGAKLEIDCVCHA